MPVPTPEQLELEARQLELEAAERLGAARALRDVAKMLREPTEVAAQAKAPPASTEATMQNSKVLTVQAEPEAVSGVA